MAVHIIKLWPAIENGDDQAVTKSFMTQFCSVLPKITAISMALGQLCMTSEAAREVIYGDVKVG